ncbi:MAG: GTP-binding protein, partial [Leptospiraceae bacterium]|nr:GTP-binding protein [Leptospiraceae bacterium]
MKTKRVINFGIFAHIDAGKTTLTERILFQEGVISSFGDIESGTTETDFLEEEISRGISIQSVVVQFDRIFRNEKFKINLIDTPGHLDFDEQVSEIVGVIDLGVLVVDVRSKVQSQTEILWKKLSEKKIPTIFFLNKTDSTDLDLRKIISELKAEFKSNLHPAFFFKKDAAAKTESILKAEKKDENILIPFLEWDSSLSEKFLESPEKIKSIAMEGLKNGFHLRAFFPVLAGSAKTGAGVGDLLDFICFVDWSSENASSRENESVYAFKKQIHPDYGKIYFFKTLQDLNRGEALFYGSERIKLERIFSPKAMNLEEIGTAEKGGIFAAVISADIPKGTTLTKAPSLLNLFGARTKGENSQQFGVVIEPVSGEDLAKLQNSVHELIWEDDSYSAKIQKFTGQLELWGQGELHIEIGLSRLAKKIGEIFSVGKLKVARYEIWK